MARMTEANALALIDECSVPDCTTRLPSLKRAHLCAWLDRARAADPARSIDASYAKRSTRADLAQRIMFTKMAQQNVTSTGAPVPEGPCAKSSAAVETISMTCPCGETHSNAQLERAGGCPNGGKPFQLFRDGSGPPVGETKPECRKRWAKDASAKLVGRRIVAVRWLTQAEVETLGWYQSAIVLHLDDGTVLWPSRDDEGNDAGALFGQGPKGEEQTWPVI